jgi:hypothetical protein
MIIERGEKCTSFMSTNVGDPKSVTLNLNRSSASQQERNQWDAAKL